MKRVGQFSIETAGKFVAAEHKALWRYYKSRFESDFLDNVPCTLTRDDAVADLSNEDIAVLLEARIIGRLFTAPKHWVRIFTTNEIAKNRRRMIAHTVDINLAEDIPEEFSISLVTLAEIEDDVRDYPLSFVSDYAAYYHSFAISQEVQPHFAFVHHEQLYCLKTIATGQRQCVGLAQLVTTGVTKIATLQARATGKFRAYIDNVKYSGGDSASVLKHFNEVTQRLGATQNKQEVECGEEVVFLGIVCNHRNKTLALSAKKLEKARRQWEVVQNTEATLRDIAGAFSFFVGAAKILGISMAPFYTVFKCLRRRVSHTAWDEKAFLWPSAIREWQQWKDLVLLNQPRSVTRQQIEQVLVTDASRSGWGAILFEHTGYRIAAGHWTSTESVRNIFELEAEAVIRATKAIRFDTTHTKLRIDNTTVKDCVRRTHSRNFWLNEKVKQIVSMNFVTIEYIASADNPADFWSRLDADQ